MSIFLDKVNSAPIIQDEFSYEFKQWCSNTVDTLNEVSSDIEDLLISQEVTPASVSPVSIDVDVNSQYIPSSTTLTSFQLPATTANDIGSRVKISGFGSGGWKLLTALGQTIQVANVPATATTSIASSSRYDCIEIILVAANTWNTQDSSTTGFVIV